MDISRIRTLRNELTDILGAGTVFFVSAAHASADNQSAQEERRSERRYQVQHDWDFLTDGEREKALNVRKQMTEIGPKLIDGARHSSLLEQADESEIRHLLRRLCAALMLKVYTYHSLEVLSDEDRVLGVQPASHEEKSGSVGTCERIFSDAGERLLEIMDLFSPPPEDLARAIVSSQPPGIQKYRPNTAFIMMQISERVPELEDVKNCIKETFKAFGVTAIRSDEIEHSDVITQRILDEIVTSEFLIADLTGERPSVYYELGYAHAVGKRPILYRKQGTPLHFDLLVHNVPEYKNTTDLRVKLRDRLAAMTNRHPKE